MRLHVAGAPRVTVGPPGTTHAVVFFEDDEFFLAGLTKLDPGEQSTESCADYEDRDLLHPGPGGGGTGRRAGQADTPGLKMAMRVTMPPGAASCRDALSPPAGTGPSNRILSFSFCTWHRLSG
jgi:hypothetical protein